ncbi:glycosyltransferase family 4 protein [Myroides marinus]|uniref:glycosyltransferase family 4 protein n=1 Tax=Myroides marinus TaxID=703342 RepID=UPI0025769092|nr:glycosyltransferase family 4 protein [Myroides marinus]MDM1503172.1 glycosyltransferase family 4 protein [Myroides marinus]
MKKKVLHVINVSFVINHFFGNQFKYFNDKGYDFTVACTEDEYLYQESLDKKFKIFPVPVLRSIAPLKDLVSIYKLFKFIKREKFDIVIAHSPKGGLIGISAAYLAGCQNRVFFRHGLVFETATGIKRLILISVEKIVGLLATKIVNVSESLIVESNKFNLNSPRKNLLLGRGTCNGIDITRFRKREKTNSNFVVGYVGRLAVDKGIVELVDAWEKFIIGKNNVELHLIGPFDERDPLSESTIRKIENIDSIKIIGFVKDTSLNYNEMNVFILPSYREGFGMVILEASASGIPVITTRKTGCINAIIEDITGKFTEITSHDIKENIEYYYYNPELQKIHGDNGVRFVQDFFTEKYIFDEIERKVFN